MDGTRSDDFFNLLEQRPACLRHLKTIEIINLRYPIDEFPFLQDVVEERCIDLKLSLHDRRFWEQDEKRYLYLVGLESESEDEGEEGGLDV